MEIEVEGERRAPEAAEEGDSQIPLTSPEGAAAVSYAGCAEGA